MHVQGCSWPICAELLQWILLLILLVGMHILYNHGNKENVQTTNDSTAYIACAGCRNAYYSRSNQVTQTF